MLCWVPLLSGNILECSIRCHKKPMEDYLLNDFPKKYNVQVIMML